MTPTQTSSGTPVVEPNGSTTGQVAAPPTEARDGEVVEEAPQASSTPEVTKEPADVAVEEYE